MVFAIWATARLVEGLVGLVAGLRFSAFKAGALLPGSKVESVPAGLAAGGRGTEAVALGTVFGGSVVRAEVSPARLRRAGPVASRAGHQSARLPI